MQLNIQVYLHTYIYIYIHGVMCVYIHRQKEKDTHTQHAQAPPTVPAQSHLQLQNLAKYLGETEGSQHIRGSFMACISWKSSLQAYGRRMLVTHSALLQSLHQSGRQKRPHFPKPGKAMSSVHPRLKQQTRNSAWPRFCKHLDCKRHWKAWGAPARDWMHRRPPGSLFPSPDTRR